MTHASLDAAADADRQGRDPSIDTAVADSKKWQADPKRLDAHRQACRIVSLAASGTSSQAAVARSLGMDLRSFQRFCDAEGGRRLAFADVIGARRDFARAVLVAALASIPEDERSAPRSPEQHAMRLTSAVGDVAERIEDAIADGNLSRDERRRLAASLHQLIERAQGALADLGDA